MKRLAFLCCMSVLITGFVCQAKAAERQFSSYDSSVNKIIIKMSLDEKIGQMIQAEQGFLNDPADIQNYHLGSLLSSNSQDPPAGNHLQAWSDMYQVCQQRALKTRLGIPLLYGVDAVHGHNNVLNAVIFPHNIGLGCTRNPALVKQIAEITASEVRATGINWAFAPCIAVAKDERWGRTYESFSEDTEIAGMLGEAHISGLQDSGTSSTINILACAKHYIGDGGTSFGSAKNKMLDQGDTPISEENLRAVHLPPYTKAVKAGVGSIMVSYSSWNGTKCSAEKYLLTDLLKNELGFEGFLISDYEAIKQVDKDYKTAVMHSVNAGIDMAMEPKNYRKFFDSLKELVQEGKVPISRIDDAVKRILRVKYAMGLMDTSYDYKPDPKDQKSFGSADHRYVAREAVRQSLVLLKNENQTLPISKSLPHIIVSGSCADDLGNQCGAWTIDWQGKSGEVTTGGTTIFEGIKKTVSDKAKVSFSNDGSLAEKADVGIVVIGETPYAEGKGDRRDLTISKNDVQAVVNMKKAGIPVVVILISGRPMIINEVLEMSDAFVAAWLPGTEAQGITDILFGDYQPTGKLSFSWPKTMSQIPINIGAKEYYPLFEFGYGLSY